VTFQQVQKYEKGTNRISAGRLQRIAEVLSVPVSFFFEGADDSRKQPKSSVDVEFSFLQTEGALRLVRAYARIKEPSVRLQLLRLTEAIAGD
jgi:transcriptional regulator with XRE-family HTH domain